jgi:sugar phosphate isomerase/epimerase
MGKEISLKKYLSRKVLIFMILRLPTWMIHGGADPMAYLKKYPGRFELMHLKELGHDIPGNNTGSAPDATSVAFGRGITNWPMLLRLAAGAGVKKYYIEDEAKDAVLQIPLTIRYLDSLR